MMKIYLCGPINGRTDADCKNWREYIKTRYKGPTADPMARDYRGRETTAMREIVENDKADIDTCDALVVYYDQPSVGTSMEILYAWERQKPVYLIDARLVELDPSFQPVPRKPLSPWLLYHSTMVVASLDDLLQLLVRS